MLQKKLNSILMFYEDEFLLYGSCMYEVLNTKQMFLQITFCTKDIIILILLFPSSLPQPHSLLKVFASQIFLAWKIKTVPRC